MSSERTQHVTFLMVFLFSFFVPFFSANVLADDTFTIEAGCYGIDSSGKKLAVNNSQFFDEREQQELDSTTTRDILNNKNNSGYGYTVIFSCYYPTYRDGREVKNFTGTFPIFLPSNTVSVQVRGDFGGGSIKKSEVVEWNDFPISDIQEDCQSIKNVYGWHVDIPNGKFKPGEINTLSVKASTICAYSLGSLVSIEVKRAIYVNERPTPPVLSFHVRPVAGIPYEITADKISNLQLYPNDRGEMNIALENPTKDKITTDVTTVIPRNIAITEIPQGCTVEKSTLSCKSIALDTKSKKTISAPFVVRDQECAISQRKTALQHILAQLSTVFSANQTTSSDLDATGHCVPLEKLADVFTKAVFTEKSGSTQALNSLLVKLSFAASVPAQISYLGYFPDPDKVTEEDKKEADPKQRKVFTENKGEVRYRITLKNTRGMGLTNLTANLPLEDYLKPGVLDKAWKIKQEKKGKKTLTSLSWHIDILRENEEVYQDVALRVQPNTPFSVRQLELQTSVTSGDTFSEEAAQITSKTQGNNIAALWTKIPLKLVHYIFDAPLANVHVDLLNPQTGKSDASRKQIYTKGFQYDATKDKLLMNEAGQANLLLNKKYDLEEKNGTYQFKLRVTLETDPLNTTSPQLNAIEPGGRVPIFFIGTIPLTDNEIHDITTDNVHKKIVLNDDPTRWEKIDSLRGMENLAMARLYTDIIAARTLVGYFFPEVLKRRQGVNYNTEYKELNAFANCDIITINPTLFHVTLRTDLKFNNVTLHEVGHSVSCILAEREFSKIDAPPSPSNYTNYIKNIRKTLKDRVKNNTLVLNKITETLNRGGLVGSHLSLFNDSSRDSFEEGLAHYLGGEFTQYLPYLPSNKKTPATINLLGNSFNATPTTWKETGTLENRCKLPLANVLTTPFADLDINYSKNNKPTNEQIPKVVWKGCWLEEEHAFAAWLWTITHGNSKLNDKSGGYTDWDSSGSINTLNRATLWDVLNLVKTHQHDIYSFTNALDQQYKGAYKRTLIRFGFFDDSVIKNGRAWKYDKNEKTGSFTNHAEFLFPIENGFFRVPFRPFPRVFLPPARNSNILFEFKTLDGEIVSSTQEIIIATQYDPPYDYLNDSETDYVTTGSLLYLSPPMGIFHTKSIITVEGSSDKVEIDTNTLLELAERKEDLPHGIKATFIVPPSAITPAIASSTTTTSKTKLLFLLIIPLGGVGALITWYLSRKKSTISQEQPPIS